MGTRTAYPGMCPGMLAVATAVLVSRGAWASDSPDPRSSRISSEPQCTQFVSGDQSVTFQAWGEDGILVTARPAAPLPPLPSTYPSALLPAPLDPHTSPPPRHRDVNTTSLQHTPTPGICRNAGTLKVSESGFAPANRTTLTVGNLRASIDVHGDGLLTFHRVSDGKLLLREAHVRSFAPSTAAPTYRELELAFGGDPTERYYGLGQHQTGALNNVDQSFEFQPVNTEILVPVLHSSRGYSVLWNLPSTGSVTLGPTGGHTWRGDAVRHLSLWVATTAAAPTKSPDPRSESQPSHRVSNVQLSAKPRHLGGSLRAPVHPSPLAELMRKYTAVTGRAPIIGHFMSGYWQSRNRYRTQTEVAEVIDGYQSLGLPLAMVIIDYFSWAPAPMGTNRFDPSCWPHPSSMTAHANASGVELMLSPYFNFIGPNATTYPAMLKAGYLARDTATNQPAAGVDNSVLYDVFNPAATRAMMAAVTTAPKSYGAVGIRHFWLDCDEPCQSPGMVTAEWNGMPHSAVGAAYPHVLARATREAMQPGTVMLGRSAWAGTQRFGAAVWSGDTNSSWAALTEQVRAGLNAQMSGITYWTTDIGGYAGGGGGVNGTGFNHNIHSPAYLELLTRWFQFGLLCPLFRSHGHRLPTLPPVDCGAGDSGGYNEVWHFAEPYRSAIVKVMRLREGMRPYVEDLFAEAAATGAPLMRLLEYEFPDDPKSATVADQYCFGPRYMTKPVTKPNTNVTRVYLPPVPAGERWSYVFNDAVPCPSGTTVEIRFGLDTFPLFERVNA